MSKIILLTGSTDGIGLATAEALASQGHQVLLHGRNPAKLEAVKKSLSTVTKGKPVDGYVADLSRMDDVEKLAQTVIKRHDKLDVLINNAGIFRTPEAITQDALDVRFAVNTIAPYLLMKRLLPLIDSDGRVVNLSSAAQSPVDMAALVGKTRIADDFAAYAQSKLALTMWSRAMALSLAHEGPIIVAVNPGSMLGSKMVQEGFGVAGGDIGIGADILTRAALSEEFASASGQYFDNDSGRFAAPHADALDEKKSAQMVRTIEAVLSEITPSPV